MKRWILLLLMPLWVLLIQSCQAPDFVDEGSAVSYTHVISSHDAHSDTPDDVDKAISAIPLGDMLNSSTESHFHLGNLFQRGLRQLVQQWNREVMKACGRYAQCMNILSADHNAVTFQIGRCSVRTLYLYHIRHIII